MNSQVNYVKTSNNGGCGECACHCHSDTLEIPPGHIQSCKFADPDYVPADFAATVQEAARQRTE